MTKNLNKVFNFIWDTADLIRDAYQKKEYPDVILPFTVLRRLDCVLEPNRGKVHEKYVKLSDTELKDLDGALKRESGYEFWNHSNYNFEKLLEEPGNIDNNFNTYINAFSPNIREILDKFRLNIEIDKLLEEDLLYEVIEHFTNEEIDLHPNSLSNHDMGYIFEQLIRKFNEQSNENPGDHFTPREVIKLMVNLLMSKDKDELSKAGKTVTVYDPACGTGGMLTVAKDHILDDINSNAIIHLFGQERNDKTFAICKSDLYIKGEAAENIAYGSSFSNDGFPTMKFDYMLSNPPYGKKWTKDEKVIKDEHKQGSLGRFEAGYPNIGDGQLLFLQHMISKMHKNKEISRIAIVMSGSALFNGDAGSGESEIRRWIMENDWLEAIIALPDQLFYNTGIFTYIWILTDKKEKKTHNKITLINAVDLFEKLPTSFGNKRNEISESQINEITNLYLQNIQNHRVKTFNSSDFGYRKIIVDRPLRMNFIASKDRIDTIKNQTEFKNLVKIKKGTKNPDKFIKDGQMAQKMIIKALNKMPEKIYYNYDEFEKDIIIQLESVGVRPLANIRKAIKYSIGEIDQNAAPVPKNNNKLEHNKDLRDSEKVPLKREVLEYFVNEVIPHVPDAWISDDKNHCDHKDGEIGKIGYEINFNKYFFEYIPPRKLEDIDKDLDNNQKDILKLLGEVIK